MYSRKKNTTVQTTVPWAPKCVITDEFGLQVYKLGSGLMLDMIDGMIPKMAETTSRSNEPCRHKSNFGLVQSVSFVRLYPRGTKTLIHNFLA